MVKRKIIPDYKFIFIVFSSMIWFVIQGATPGFTQDAKYGMHKIRDLVIYENASFYSSFPSVVRLAGGELLVAFRRAPDRRLFSEKVTSHVDPNSYLVMVHSKNNAKTWTFDPDLIFAHPLGGSQDPCLLKLRNGNLLCTSYAWAFVRPEGLANLKQPVAQNASGSVFLGGYYVISENGGKHGRDHITLLIYLRKLIWMHSDNLCLPITEVHFMKVKTEEYSG